ncbi:MAG: GlxA family transcriptional regulator [Gammaproteobacteria bacterium]|nr:GlxA family transcriptional regulator [Gammaproteobacteria bacterium]
MISDRHFVFVLIPRFSLWALSCAIDALRAANRDLGNPVYRWTLASIDSDSVESSSGIALPASSLATVSDANVIALCGGDSSHSYRSDDLVRWLRNEARRDVMIGSLSDGAFVAAAAGLFDHYRSTIHWKCQDAYRLRHPELDIRASILEIDRRRFSCAGGTSSLDLMLHFIREDLGTNAVVNITDNYFHDTVRDSSQGQHLAEAYRHASKSRVLSEALAIMSSNLDQSISIADISRQAGTSHRSLDRLFQRHLGATPGQHFRQLRISRAATLLTQTGLPVSDIALNCGFSTASHLGRYFRDIYGLSPNQYRQAERTKTS